MIRLVRQKKKELIWRCLSYAKHWTVQFLIHHDVQELSPSSRLHQLPPHYTYPLHIHHRPGFIFFEELFPVLLHTWVFSIHLAPVRRLRDDRHVMIRLPNCGICKDPKTMAAEESGKVVDPAGEISASDQEKEKWVRHTRTNCVLRVFST
jgi:hypothetical protein